MNIMERVENLEKDKDSVKISILENKIKTLEEIIENKLGFYIPKR